MIERCKLNDLYLILKVVIYLKKDLPNYVRRNDDIVLSDFAEPHLKGNLYQSQSDIFLCLMYLYGMEIILNFCWFYGLWREMIWIVIHTRPIQFYLLTIITCVIHKLAVWFVDFSCLILWCWGAKTPNSKTTTFIGPFTSIPVEFCVYNVECLTNVCAQICNILCTYHGQ